MLVEHQYTVISLKYTRIRCYVSELSKIRSSDIFMRQQHTHNHTRNVLRRKTEQRSEESNAKSENTIIYRVDCNLL